MSETLSGVDIIEHVYDLPAGSGIAFRRATGAATGMAAESANIVYLSNALYNHAELRPTAVEVHLHTLGSTQTDRRAEDK